MNGQYVEKPFLQILDSKSIAGTETELVRLMISDGQYFNSYALLDSSLNHLFHEGKLSKNTIICCNKYTTSLVDKSQLVQ